MIFQSSFYQTKRILLVDDCEPIRASIRGMLQQIGFEHITAVPDAQAALEKAELYSFDFILADFQLGDGLNGYQLFEALKKREQLKPGCCVVLTSAESMRQPLFGLIERQPDCYIQKPFTYLTLEKRLARAIQQRMAVRKVFQALNASVPQALLECDRVVKDAPQHALYALRLKAELLLLNGQAELAATLYQQLLQTRAFSWAALGQAIAWLQHGQIAAAQAQLLELSKTEEARPEALDWLIRLTLKQQPEQALSLSQELTRVLPQSVDAARVLATITAISLQWDDAIRLWQKVAQQFRYSALDSPQHYLNPARLLLWKLQHSKPAQPALLLSKAEECLQAIPKRFQSDNLQPELQLLQARIAILQGDVLIARALYTELASLNWQQLPVAAVVDFALLALALGDSKAADILAAQLPQRRYGSDLVAAVEAANSEFWQQQLAQLCQDVRGWMQQGQKYYRQQSFQHAVSRLWQAFLFMPGNSNLALSLWQSLASLPPAAKVQPMLQLVCRTLQQSELEAAGQRRFDALYQKLSVHYTLPVQDDSSERSA